MAVLRDTIENIVLEEDAKRRERLVMKLSTINIDQLPAIEEWIKTGDKDAIVGLCGGADNK